MCTYRCLYRRVVWFCGTEQTVSMPVHRKSVISDAKSLVWRTQNVCYLCTVQFENCTLFFSSSSFCSRLFHVMALIPFGRLGCAHFVQQIEGKYGSEHRFYRRNTNKPDYTMFTEQSAQIQNKCGCRFCRCCCCCGCGFVCGCWFRFIFHAVCECVVTLLNARYTCYASLRLLYLWCASNCTHSRERERECYHYMVCTLYHTETVFLILIITFSRAKQIIIMLWCVSIVLHTMSTQWFQQWFGWTTETTFQSFDVPFVLLFFLGLEWRKLFGIHHIDHKYRMLSSAQFS